MTATATLFDFSTPRRIAPHGQTALREWQEILCAAATENCASLLEGSLTWKIETIETHKTRLLLQSLTDQHLMYHVAVAEESVGTLWYWDQASAAGIVASLLGSLEAPAPRGLTAVEQALLEMVLDNWTRAFTATWPVGGANDAVFSRVTNTRFAGKLMERVEDVVAIQYSVTSSLGSFPANWLAPKSYLEEHLDDISGDLADAVEDGTASIEMLAADIPIALSVELGRKTVPLSRIRSLQEHDVIILDQSIHEPLRILVEGAVKMFGLPGRIDNRQLIKVVSMADV
jgi:flagellar motor switch protein FliM